MKIFTINLIPNERDHKFWTSLTREVLAEFISTFILVVLGCSANVALGVNPQNTPNFRVDQWAVNMCWGFGAFAGIAASFSITGGHINPAVSIAMASIGKFDWKKVIPYISAQMTGAIIGTGVVYWANIDVLNLQNDHILIRNNTQFLTYGHSLSTGKFFATYPQHYMTLLGCIVDQVVGTASLLFAVCVVTDQKNLNIPKALQPFMLAFVVGCHAIAYGCNTGAPLNPARDLGPRIFSSWVVYGKEAFTALDGNYWWSGGVVGPIVGAVVGVWIYYFFIEYPTPNDNTSPEPISQTKLKSNTCINGEFEQNTETMKPQITVWR